MRHPEIPGQNKTALRQLYKQLNPAELKRTIGKLQEQLFHLASTKEQKRKQQLLKELNHTNHTTFNYIPIEAFSTSLE